MSKQTKIISARCGNIRPCSIEDYINTGGYTALKKALYMKPLDIIGEVEKSNLMGRGGAAYPAGKKWEHLYRIKKDPKYVVCNADEGEPGTFKDQLLLNKDPFEVIEGMTIAGYVFNSHDGYIYIRGEYTLSQKIMKKAIEEAKKAGYLGDNILGKNFSYDIHVISGAGAYVCGENSALLNSIEGKAGRPRIKPPHLAEVGLFEKPTLVNNVESYACIPYIVENGGAAFSRLGTEYSGGTKLMCLSGNVNNRDVFEVPFGITLRELVYDKEFGNGIKNGRKLKMVHIGGQSGPCFPEELLDTKLCYKELKAKGLSVGSGALVVIDDSNCIIDYLLCVSEFFIHESCGKCTPCREGNRQIHALLSKFTNGTASHEDLKTITRLSKLMKTASFCGLGQTATAALDSCLKYFMNEFEEHIDKKCRAGVCNFNGGVK